MADKISVSYDANVDDLKRKLDELIAKNQQLSNAANAAQKAMSGLNSSVSATNNAFNQSTTVINNYNNSVNTTNNSVNQMNSSLRQTQREVRGFEKGLQNIAGKIAAAFAITKVVEFGKSIVNVARQTELLQNRLAFTYGSLIAGQLAFDRLYQTAQKLGLEFAPLIEGFSKFSIAAKMVGFSARQAEDMFTKVSAGLRASGASSVQTQRAFLALEQMLSKGVVAAEELRRQLGEALPGATALMTKAYNELNPGQEVTVKQFMKLQEEGKIISAEILPQFANVIEKTLAPALAGKAGSLDAAMNRMNASFENVKRTLGMANLQNLVNTISFFGKRIENMVAVMAKPATDQEQDPIFGGIFTAAQALNQFIFGDWLKDAKKAKKELEKDYQELLQAGLNLAIGYATLAKGATDRVDPKNLNAEELIEAMRMVSDEYEKIDKATLEKTPKQIQKLRALQLAHGELNAILTEQAQTEQKALEKSIEGQASLDNAMKEAIAKAKERLALEETRLLKTTEGTEEYKNQLIKVIEARKDLVKIEKAATPFQMNLDLAKLDKELEEYENRIAEKQDKELKKRVERRKKELGELGEAELEMAIRTAKGVVDVADKGTKERLMAERNLARQVAKLELFKVSISTDSEELKALKIKLINTELFNKLTSLSVDYVNDQKEAQDKVVEETQKANDRIIDIIQEANDLIERTEGDSYQRRIARSNQMFEDMARKIKEEMSKTKDFPTLEALKKKLKEVEDAGEKAASAITLDQAANMVSQVGDLYGELSKRQSVLYENEQNNLKKMLDQKLISEEEYERRSMELKKKQFNQERQSAIISAIIDGASGIMKAIAAFQYWQIPLITALTAAQISTISAQQFPGFKDGVIDLKGPGSETSDSIPTRLSRGESVMTAEETKRYKPVLQAIRDGEFEAFVAKKYTGGISAHRDSDSFAQNISNSFEMQTAELANLLRQNRKVAVKNVDELAKAINHRGTAHKVINRRTTR